MISAPPLDPATCRLEELTQHIRDTHHAYLRGELPAVWELLREGLGASPAARTAIRPFAQLFGQFCSTLESHLRKEEEEVQFAQPFSCDARKPDQGGQCVVDVTCGRRFEWVGPIDDYQRIVVALTSTTGYSNKRRHMATTRKTFTPIPAGTNVTWHYRSAIGHGTVVRVHKLGTTAANTMYDVRQHDHHPGEPAIVHHTGKALSKARQRH